MRRIGEEADGGTIFLDEIGELSLAVQAKLLRVLQQRAFERVGGNKTFTVDIRIIAATNKNLADMVARGTFREDLYFRLNVFPLVVPPLRERGSDFVTLAEHFVTRYAAENGKPIKRIPTAPCAARTGRSPTARQSRPSFRKGLSCTWPWPPPRTDTRAIPTRIEQSACHRNAISNIAPPPSRDQAQAWWRTPASRSVALLRREEKARRYDGGGPGRCLAGRVPAPGVAIKPNGSRLLRKGRLSG